MSEQRVVAKPTPHQANQKMGKFIAALLLVSCVDSTGGQLVRFEAVARGDGVASFTTPKGYEVTLTRARVAVGAVYLNQSAPGSYQTETACVLPGIYSGEVRGGLVIDALSTEAKKFPVEGVGTSFAAETAEVWLTSGDVNATEDRTVVLDVAGTARKGADTFPFEGRVTIGSNRAIPPRDPALPGSNPICKQRIVSPIPAAVTLREGAKLRVTVKPQAFFSNVEFSELKNDNGVFRFADSSEGQPSTALYQGLRAAKGTWAVELE